MKIRVTNHAAARYIERVKPTYDEAQAIFELQRLARVSDYTLEPPSWARYATHADLWLTIADGICIPLQRVRSGHPTFVATTCLTRAGASEDVKQSRKDWKKKQQLKKQLRKNRHTRKAAA